MIGKSTMAASMRMVGVYQPAYRSIRRISGIRVFSASRISDWTWPSFDSSPTLVTLMSIAPVRFVVPPNTSSELVLSTGIDSPVMLA